MTKRQLWLTNCLLWAGIWFVMGVIVPPFWIFTVLSLAVMLLPVGVPETPSPKHMPNPDEWSKHHGNT